MDLDFFEPYLVQGAPNSAYYLSDFITAEEEQQLLQHIYNVPKPKWTYLSNRKLQDYGGIPHIKGMIPETIPAWLLSIMDRVSDLNVFAGKDGRQPARANHCLINEYQPGQGIMPHFDGPIFHPTITTISCGSHTMLEFLQEEDGRRTNLGKILLEPRSLVILQNDMYLKYLHAISESVEDVVGDDCFNLNHCKGKKVGDIFKRQTRVSLTIRSVPKVIKCNLFNLNK